MSIDSSHDVFMSHSSRDIALAEKIAAFLQENGVSVWISNKNIRPGDDYASAILRGIESARCFLLLLSEHANRSNAVRSEVERAFNRSKPIIPVKLQPLTLSRSLEFFLSTSQWLNNSLESERNYAEVLHAVTPFACRGSSSVPPVPIQLGLRSQEPTAMKTTEVSLDDFTRRERTGLFGWFLELFDEK